MFELYNNSASTINLSGFVIKDSKNANIFTIPNETYLPTNEYLVISSDTALFGGIHYPIKNVMGNFPFSLSNNNEVIRVYDSNEVIVYSVW